MTSLFDHIEKMLTERAHMANADCPNTKPIAENEIALGELPQKLRPLWQLCSDFGNERESYQGQVNKWLSEHPHFDLNDQDPAHEPTLTEYHWLCCINTLTDLAATKFWLLFFTRVKITMPQARRYRKIGLRAKWQVVGIN